MIEDYSHVVSVVEKDNSVVIRIDRLIAGRKDFCTEIEVPQGTAETQWDLFEKLAATLGRTLCIDSPRVRSQLKIDDESGR